MSSVARRSRVAALIAVASLGLTGCAGDDGNGNGNGNGGSDGGAEISLSAIDNEFDPTDLSVTPGDDVTVTFTNDGSAVHTFTSEDLGFDTGNVDPGASKTVTFTAPEEATRFVCTLHEQSDNMVGQILPTM